MENISHTKVSKCFLCNGTGFIKNTNRFHKKSNYSYENRFQKYLLWVECPRCLGYGKDTVESGSKRWDKYHFSF